MAIRYEDTKDGLPAPKPKVVPPRAPVLDADADADAEAKPMLDKRGKPIKPDRRSKGR